VLILARHGQTAPNASGLLLGRGDPPLNDLGRREAEALATVPLIGGADRVVCSPLLRTRQTAEALGLPITVDERWIEVDYGIYEGLPVADVPSSEWKAWRADATFSPPGGESIAHVAQRVRAACESLAAEASSSDVVVVSHVSPIKAGIAWALGVADEVIWRMFLATTGVSTIVIGVDGPTLRSFNETSHRPS